MMPTLSRPNTYYDDFKFLGRNNTNNLIYIYKQFKFSLYDYLFNELYYYKYNMSRTPTFASFK